MFFNSYIFILLFIPLLLIGYFTLNHFKKYQWATAYLTAMSLWFYGYYNLYFLGAFLVSILGNYLLSKGLLKLKGQTRGAKCLLTVGIMLNAGYLFVCKYMGFFTETINDVFHTSFSFFKIAMPLGISFYTFQQIAYLVDSYRKETEENSLLEYTAFMSFFPQVIEGPIMLHGEWIPKLRDVENRKVNYENLLKGFYGFSLGLAKKVLIADSLASVVTAGFGDISSNSATDAWVVMLCYTLQLYFDFSGYSDMALGLGTMLNLEVPINFNSPYKAVSIGDFWDRWHMTLTRFFTKYIYIPLGGSRKGTLRTYGNVLLIFLISGFWHGAAWNYVFWGCMNGIAMVLYRMGRKWYDKIPKLLRIMMTFLFQVFAWTMFRASSIKSGLAMMKKVFTASYVPLSSTLYKSFNGIFEIKVAEKLCIPIIGERMPELFLLVVIVLLLFAVFFMKNTQEKMKQYQPTVWKMLVAVFCLTWSLISLGNVTEFLYVNF